MEVPTRRRHQRHPYRVEDGGAADAGQVPTALHTLPTQQRYLRQLLISPVSEGHLPNTRRPLPATLGILAQPAQEPPPLRAQDNATMGYLFSEVGTPRWQGLCSLFASCPFWGVPETARVM